MEQSPSWDANNHSANQEIPHSVWNPKVHYHVHSSLPLVHILSQMHPVHTSPSYFPKIHSNIIYPSMPVSSKWSLPFQFSNQNTVYISHLFQACYMPCSSHPWVDHPNNIWWSVQVRKLLTMQSSPASSHFLLLRCKCSPQHPVLKHYICSSLSTADHISHPYKTMGKILILFILIVVFLREMGRWF